MIDKYHTKGCCRLIARLRMASNPCLARLAASFLFPASKQCKHNNNRNTKTRTQMIQTQHQTHKMKKTTFPLKMGPLSHSASSTSSSHVHNVDLFGRNIFTKERGKCRNSFETNLTWFATLMLPVTTVFTDCWKLMFWLLLLLLLLLILLLMFATASKMVKVIPANIRGTS